MSLASWGRMLVGIRPSPDPMPRADAQWKAIEDACRDSTVVTQAFQMADVYGWDRERMLLHLAYQALVQLEIHSERLQAIAMTLPLAPLVPKEKQ